mgnify:CR=1 FL=1
MKRSISQKQTGKLADLLQSLFATLTEYYTNGTNVTSYQSGDCFGNSHMPELCQHVLTANEYLKEKCGRDRACRSKDAGSIRTAI